MRTTLMNASVITALTLVTTPASAQSSHVTTGFGPNTPNAEVAPPPTWTRSPMLFWPYQSVPPEVQSEAQASQSERARPAERLGQPSTPLPEGPNAIAHDRIVSPHDNQSPQH